MYTCTVIYLYINCLVHDPMPNFDTLPKMSYISMFLLSGPKHKVLANKREDGKCDAGQLWRVLRHNFGRNLLMTNIYAIIR